MELALLLTLVAIIGIVAYLNRITRQQYVGRIVERITEETLLAELPYGTNVGGQVGEAGDPARRRRRWAPPLVIRAGRRRLGPADHADARS